MRRSHTPLVTFSGYQSTYTVHMARFLHVNIRLHGPYIRRYCIIVTFKVAVSGGVPK